MKQYPLYKRDAITRIDQVVNLAKVKKAIWDNVWKRTQPASWLLRLQTFQLLKMLEQGRLYEYRPKVYAFYDELPYEDQVPDRCQKCTMSIYDEEKKIYICSHKFDCDTWPTFMTKKNETHNRR